MSLPGLGLLAAQTSSTTAPISPTASEPTTHDLIANSEWRFEVSIGSSIEVKLLSGTAELFGTELALNHAYTFRGTKAAIFTHHGCRLAVLGPCEEYTAEETPMTQYTNVHFALENLRNAAAPDGPRVLLVGPNNAGKTSLAKLLAAYATRAGRQPLVVNTDPREGMLSVPGALTAAVMGSVLDVEEGWGSSPTSGPSAVPVKLPVVYFYGRGSPEDDPKLFKPVCTRLALAVTGRLAEDEEVRRAGCIIDTPGVISQGKNGYEIISHIVSEFSVNVIIVLGSERLHSDMLRRFSAASPPITVLKLDKSGGCADRDEAFMSAFRQSQIREYFFGTPGRTLSPHTQTVDFAAVTIYRIAEDGALLSSFLPGGEEDVERPVMQRAEPSAQMLHCVMAVVYAGTHDPVETIRDASVMGFVYVAEVDEKKRRLRVLAPLGGKIGDRPLVWGSWPEAAVSLI